MTVSGWHRPLAIGKWPLKSICHRSLGAACSNRCGCSRRARRRVDASMPPQYLGDGAGARDVLVGEIEEPAPDLPSAPARMSLADRQHQRLHPIRRAVRRAPWPARAVEKTGFAFAAVAPRQPVAQLAADPEASA